MKHYPTRYQAEKNRKKTVEIVVKVCGGYLVMDWAEYRQWKRTK